MLTTIKKWGNGRAVRLSKTILDSAQIKDNDQVNVTSEKGKITIVSVARRHKTLEERFEGYMDVYAPEDVDWGELSGKEE